MSIYLFCELWLFLHNSFTPTTHTIFIRISIIIFKLTGSTQSYTEVASNTLAFFVNRQLSFSLMSDNLLLYYGRVEMHYIILYITVRTRTYNYIDLVIVEFQNMK